MDLALLALFASLVTAICQSVTDLGTKAATRDGGRSRHSCRAMVRGRAAADASRVSSSIRGSVSAPRETLAALTKPEFWTLLAWSGALNVVAYALYIRAFRLSDASLVAPLVLLTPVLMLVTSPIMTGEQAPPMGVFGVLFTVLGVGLLDADQTNGRRFNFHVFARDKGARMMIAHCRDLERHRQYRQARASGPRRRSSGSRR